MPSPLNYLQIGAVHLDVPLPAPSQEARGELQPAEVDLLVLESSGGRHVESGQARRAMEQLAARHAPDAIRVATLTPSGRPIALRCGDLAGMQVSATHAGGLIVAQRVWGWILWTRSLRGRVSIGGTALIPLH